MFDYLTTVPSMNPMTHFIMSYKAHARKFIQIVIMSTSFFVCLFVIILLHEWLRHPVNFGSWFIYHGCHRVAFD